MPLSRLCCILLASFTGINKEVTRRIALLLYE